MDIVEEIHQPPMSSTIMPSSNKRVHSPSPQKVQGTASTEKELRLKCINRSCKSGRNLTDAISIACNYYQVTNKKNKKVCLKCLNKCIIHHKRLTLKWQNGGSVFDCRYPNFEKHYIIESSSSEDEEQEQQKPMPSTSTDLPNKENSITEDIIGQVVEKFFVYNKSCIKDQLELCKTHLIAKTKKRMSEMDSLIDMASNLENKVNTLKNKLYEPYTPNSHVIETVDLGTLDKSYLKSVTNKTKDYQSNKLKIHGEIKLKDPNIDKDVILHSKRKYTPPSDLPNFGTLEYPPFKAGDQIYVMKLGFVQPWGKAKIISVINKDHMHVQIDDDLKLCTTKEIAYYTINPVRFPVGTRVIAKFRKKCSSSMSGFNYNFYCGVIGEDPSTINTFRYLVFFDDGNVQYRKHKYIRLVAHETSCVSNDVHPDLKEFIKSYLAKYPLRHMVRLTENNHVRAKCRKRWEVAKVMKVDAALVQLYFTDLKEFEWFYRGSSRLWNIYEKESKSEKGIRLRQSGLAYLNKPFVECTSLEESGPKATARKSTSKSSASNKNQIEKNMLNQHILYDTKAIQLPENVPRPKKYTIHNCDHSCVDWAKYDQQKIKTIHMLAIPLHLGFKRFLVYFNNGLKCIIYKTPCGKTIRNMKEMFSYLIVTQCKIIIDQFDFSSWVNTLNEFKVLKFKTFMQDLSSGQELKGISVVNNIDNRLPPSMVYLNSRRAMPGVEINLDSNFLCGCDCTDNCQDKSKCACWQMTIEGQKVLPNTYKDPNIGYSYRRLPERVITGIYECNKNCKCSSSCLNRVVQYPLSQKLQLFLTENKGWGVRCLNDIPQGSFICVYVGYLLTESDANEGGMNYGDEYLAELDYIEVVEKIKEDFESDLPISDEAESDNNENEDSFKESDTSDEDYQSTSEGKSSNSSDMSLRKRKPTINTKTKRNSKNVPSTLNSDNKKNKPEPSKSVREYFGSNESVYIMDAKTSGNIGRYLNHSCCPNTFVQNVFVDTHDLRFPWISFFALHYIPAGTELTWDYSYEIGSVPGKVMKCHCGSVYCRGRLL